MEKRKYKKEGEKEKGKSEGRKRERERRKDESKIEVSARFISFSCLKRCLRLTVNENLSCFLLYWNKNYCFLIFM